MESWTWQEWLIACLTLVIFTTVLLIKFRLEIRLRWKGIYVDGEIINWMSAIDEGKRYYYPLIIAHLPSGKELKFRAEERCEHEPMFPIGTKVRIKLLQQQPDIRQVEYPDQK
ncbi:MAG: hypothetical protein RLZZ262_2384 [Bacteroidota bacterium]|jgi:hypothetical protein